MAYIKKRGKKWQAQVSWYDLHNERKYKTKGGFLTKRQAQEWANKMEVAKDEQHISNRDPIFAEYFKDWYTTYKIPGKSKTTVVRYNTIYKKLKDSFGQAKLSKITRHDYQTFITDYGKAHAKDTVYKTNGSIRSCVADAIADGIIHKNFTQRINLTWNSERTRKIDYLSYAELQKLKDALLDNIKPWYISRYMLLTIMYTGMRPGEIAVLTWDDIDFKNETINVNKSYNHDLGRVEDYEDDEINKATKNANSVRIIKVDKKFLDIIQGLKQNNHHRIFIDRDDTIPTSNAVNKTLRKALKKCDIDKPTFHFHSLRHSHVALLLFKGVPLYAISKRLGHASMSTTAKKYAYMLDELKQQSDTQITKILDNL